MAHYTLTKPITKSDSLVTAKEKYELAKANVEGLGRELLEPFYEALEEKVLSEVKKWADTKRRTACVKECSYEIGNFVCDVRITKKSKKPAYKENIESLENYIIECEHDALLGLKLQHVILFDEKAYINAAHLVKKLDWYMERTSKKELDREIVFDTKGPLNKDDYTEIITFPEEDYSSWSENNFILAAKAYFFAKAEHENVIIPYKNTWEKVVEKTTSFERKEGRIPEETKKIEIKGVKGIIVPKTTISYKEIFDRIRSDLHEISNGNYAGRLNYGPMPFPTGTKKEQQHYVECRKTLKNIAKFYEQGGKKMLAYYVF